MQSLKFVHCADLHLDAPFREHGREGYAETRRRDIREALSRIIERTNAEKADLLLISGDLYEHRTLTKKTLDWLCMKLAEVQAPVVLVPGNHDPYLQNSWYRNAAWPSNVHILSPESPYLVLDKLKAALYGVGFSSYKEGKPDLSKVNPPKEGYFNILMLHGTLDMDFSQEAYKPVSSQELEALGYDYYALGHFHKQRRDYPLKKAFNPGSPEPLGFDEPGIHGAFLVSLSQKDTGIELSVESFRTASRVYHDLELHVSGLKSLEEIRFKLLTLLEKCDPEQDLVRVTLKGRTELGLEPETLISRLFPGWFYLRLMDETLKAHDYEALSKDPSLKGAFVRQMLDKLKSIEEAMAQKPGSEALQRQWEITGRALVYGLEAMESGRIESLEVSE
ncbi:MAG: DNA repair exonuclease [Clostridia bacterium]|nr:DNA repair exonuclease [Clostridia bacterium]